MKLSEEQLARAVSFIETDGRPLERARLAFQLGQGTAAEVLAHLAAFQNDDGGFGHGLEPDLRTPASSALCTSVALQILRELGTGHD